jgi:hypothetical protein
MDGDFLARVGDMLVGRWSGPMWVRFVIQPSMAALLAIRAGWRDAHAGRPAFLWEVAHNRDRRRELLREGWLDVRQLFVLALAVDVAYELIAYRWIYPVQALLVAATLAFVPYALIRGPVTRLFRRHHRAH